MNNIYELAVAIGLDVKNKRGSEVLAILAKSIYKSSLNGVCLQQVKATKHENMHPEVIWAVGISCIVEGTEIEIPTRTLAFPFSIGAFWNEVSMVEKAADDAFAEWEAQGD